MPDTTPLLDLQHINTYYGASQAVFDLSLSCQPGQVTTLLGRNGMGKTTTVHSIMGITPNQSGEIHFAGQRIDGQSPYRIAQHGIGLVPEGRHIFPNLTVRENLIATAANLNQHSTPWTLEKIVQFFPRLGERLRHMGNQLSGGEQQMLAIGRALMLNPKLLILDEATEGLAPLIRQEIWQRLAALKENGVTILLIDKHIDELTPIADQHYLIEKGHIAWSGNTQALREQPELIKKYLGI